MTETAGSPVDRFSMSPGSREPDESISVAAIYVRTSVSKPEYHYSLEEQLKRCWKRCEEQGWEVVFVFEDEAESGTTVDRPQFQDMLRKAREGLFDVVVFWSLDRFCRSLVDLVKTEEKLSEWGIALHSVTEFIDTASAVGRFNFRNLASAAELESDLTSQRVLIGMHGMAQEHRWPNNSPPLGYDLADDQTLVVIDEEAELVRTIFNLYLEVRSMPRVAHQLNERGYATKSGSNWDRWSVRKVLQNEVYVGKYRLGEYVEHVDEYQILSHDLYEEVESVRHRFQPKESMSKDRKQEMATKILDQFKTNKTED